MSIKKSVKSQQYEKYWKLTLGFSDINGPGFIDTLTIITNKFNNVWGNSGASSKEYQELTEEIKDINSYKDSGSARKAINQFIKLGFFKPGFKAINPNTEKFLNARSNDARKKIYSDIVYNCASFNSSYTKDDTDQNQINFALKTLMFHPNRKLNIEELKAITMVGDLNKYKRGYMTQKDLDKQIKIMNYSKFSDRKFNQINYIMNCLGKLEGLTYHNYSLSYIEDDIFNVNDNKFTKRDPYQWRLTRSKLIEESINNYGDARCFYSYYKGKGLVASHIIPFAELVKEGKIDLAYDYKNTLLLKPEVDAYFDKNEMSFDTKGNPLFSSKIDNKVLFELQHYNHNKLDDCILDEKRIELLNHHRKVFLDKNSTLS